MAHAAASAGCRVEMLESPKLISAAADEVRNKYIEFVAGLPAAVKRDGKNLKEYFAIDACASLWWFSLIAEKNTFKSDVFHRLAQLHSITDIVRSEGVGKILLICSSRKLRNALAEYAAERAAAFEELPADTDRGLKRRLREGQGFFFLKHFSLAVFSLFELIARAWRIRRRLSGLSRRPAREGSLVFVTYYPNMDIELAKKGVFKNRYCPYLQDAAESGGMDLAWIAMYVRNNAVALDEAVGYAEGFINNGSCMMFPEEYISLRLLITVALGMFVSSIKFLAVERSIRRAHSFDGYNFYPLFVDDWYASFTGSAGYLGLLYYRVFKRMLKEVSGRKCLYYCEMQAWERALLSAREAVRSDMTLLGYQHATVSPMFLNYFNGPGEINDSGVHALPKPDKIICNGPLTYRNFLACGWPESRLYVAEALRYFHLREQASLNRSEKERVVLVAFSIDAEESSALLSNVYEALKDLRDTEVWIKSHPFLSCRKVLELSGLQLDEGRFKIKDSPVGELLPHSRIVVAGESGVSLEALAFGCSVILINAPEVVNMSPLRGIESYLIHEVFSPEELRQQVEAVLYGEQDMEKAAAEAWKILNDFFCLDDKSDTPVKFMKLLNDPD